MRTDGVTDNRHLAAALLGASAVFLVLPAANYVTFAGIPFDSLPQYLCLLALAPIVIWPWLRRRWCAMVGRWPVRWFALAMVMVVAGVFCKTALFVSGDYGGFPACYRALYRHANNFGPRPDDRRTGRCEKAWENPLGRFHATRIDRKLDFGPDDWNLSFVNDNRFNFYNWRNGSVPRERLPFSASWRGVISSPEAQEIAFTYVGQVQVWLGMEPIELPPSYGVSRTDTVHVPAGRHGLVIAYTFDDGSRIGVPAGAGATFRLTSPASNGGGPLRTQAVPLVWRLAGWTVDLLASAVAALLLLFWLRVAGTHWRLLLAGGITAGIVYAMAAEWQAVDSHALVMVSLLVPGGAILFGPRRPSLLAAAYWYLAVIMLAQEAGAATSLEAVLVRWGGSDFLTYESLSRTILDTGSLRGGEDVFFYQPFFRYMLFVGRIILGDGDVLIPAFVQTALVVAPLYMAWTFGAGRAKWNVGYNHILRWVVFWMRKPTLRSVSSTNAPDSS